MKKVTVLLLSLAGFIVGTTSALATADNNIGGYHDNKLIQGEPSTDAQNATESSSKPRQE